MSIVDKLARLRPLMGTVDVAAILDMEETVVRRSITLPETIANGVDVHRGGGDQIIDSVTFSLKFRGDLPVPGLQLGMDATRALETVPALKLAPGETGEPNKYGWIRYSGARTADGFDLSVSVREGKVSSVSLTRPDHAEVHAERKRQNAEHLERERLRHERENRWKTIVDSDEMLESWAASCSPWGEAPTKYIAFAQWLRTSATPDQRHLVAQTWNWDYTHAPLLWMVRQPDCDMATALTIFFMGEPFYYLEFADRSAVPGHSVEVYDLLVEIRSRFDRGFFTRSEIAFDGEARMASVYRSKADPGAIKRFYPPQASRNLFGRDLSVEHNGGGVWTPYFDIT